MNKTFKVLAVVLAVAMLSALCAVFAVAEESGLVVDLESLKPINGATATLTSGNEKVYFLGSPDGINYYDLNAGGAVAVTDGVATLNFNTRGDLFVQYVCVVDADDATKSVAGTVEVVEGNSETALSPEGPYTVSGLNEPGYGICIFKAEDAPDGFGVNDAEVFESNGKKVNLPMCQITICEEVDENVYKILWNDVNGWPSKQHDNEPDGVEGIDYRDGKVYLKENQIVMAIMSAGAYATSGDGENSTAKWVIRGLKTNGFVQVGEGQVFFLANYDVPEPAVSYPFWISHIDPEKEYEGAGAIWTSVDASGGWSAHLAFEPVEGKKTVFKLTALVPGDGNAKALEVPEGGFVYAINAGNNWPALIAANGITGDGSKNTPGGIWYDDPEHVAMPNYNTANVIATWDIIPSLEVGEIYTIANFDLEGKTVPTSTPDKDYWDPEYVCTATITKGDHEEDAPISPEPEDNYKEEIAEKPGQPVPDTVFNTEMTSELDEDGNVTVTLTINGMKAEDKIIGFQIPVYFDAERLTPVLDDVVDDALNCVAEDGFPGKNWENLTAAKAVEKNGKTYIYFQCGTAKTDYCDENTELVATFKFTLNEGFDKAGAWTENRDAKCFIDDGQMTTVYGVASYTVAEAEEETPVQPTPTIPTEETPGDAGIIVFAILGVLAVIGAAVVIKVRK